MAMCGEMEAAGVASRTPLQVSCFLQTSALPSACQRSTLPRLPDSVDAKMHRATHRATHRLPATACWGLPAFHHSTVSTLAYSLQHSYFVGWCGTYQHAPLRDSSKVTHGFFGWRGPAPGLSATILMATSSYIQAGTCRQPSVGSASPTVPLTLASYMSGRSSGSLYIISKSSGAM
jgi:hypothetical protein